MEEYDLYLEMIEDISMKDEYFNVTFVVYKLVNDVDVDKTKKMVEQYKKDNKELIKRNRTKQVSLIIFVLKLKKFRVFKD